MAESYQLHVKDTFIHHNAYFAGDKETLQSAQQYSSDKFPDKKWRIISILADGDKVFIHFHIQLQPEHDGYSVAHVYRFEGDKIVEMWDFGQEVPEDSPNQNGMF